VAVEAPHAVGVVALADVDAVVLRQLGRPRGRSAARQVGGCGAQQPPIWGEAPRNHARIGRLAEADAHVEPIVRQRRWLHRKLQL